MIYDSLGISEIEKTLFSNIPPELLETFEID
jgi:hypothetical protein